MVVVFGVYTVGEVRDFNLISESVRLKGYWAPR